MMLGSLLFKSEEERLCSQYSRLMNRAYKLALVDKEKSDKLNARATKIMEQLKRMNYKGLDNCL